MSTPNDIHTRISGFTTVTSFNAFLEKLDVSIQSGGRQFSYKKTEGDRKPSEPPPTGRAPLREILAQAVSLSKKADDASPEKLQAMYERIKLLDESGTKAVENLGWLSIFSWIGIKISSAWHRTFGVSNSSQFETIQKQIFVKSQYTQKRNQASQLEQYYRYMGGGALKDEDEDEDIGEEASYKYPKQIRAMELTGLLSRLILPTDHKRTTYQVNKELILAVTQKTLKAMNELDVRQTQNEQDDQHITKEDLIELRQKLVDNVDAMINRQIERIQEEADRKGSAPSSEIDTKHLASGETRPKKSPNIPITHEQYMQIQTLNGKRDNIKQLVADAAESFEWRFTPDRTTPRNS